VCPNLFTAKKLKPLISLVLKSGVDLRVVDKIGITDMPRYDVGVIDDHTFLKQSYLHADIYRINEVIRKLINIESKNMLESGIITISFDLVSTDMSFDATHHASDVIGVLQIEVIAQFFIVYLTI